MIVFWSFDKTYGQASGCLAPLKLLEPKVYVHDMRLAVINFARRLSLCRSVTRSALAAAYVDN